ncbi:AfsR/SARP family transcriptional regulator [Kitasatospora sp. NPDC051853]|uniref:AfsR/SARP family transcriptional regulator n=1 Tax=Kitasatospora sp. NPDC051853 TaxID=3364058 RepID=UPI0037B13DD8
MAERTARAGQREGAPVPAVPGHGPAGPEWPDPDEGFCFQLLGPVRGRLDGRELELGPPLQRAVLAVLLLRAGRPVGPGELVEALWGQCPPERAAEALRRYVRGLRAVLEPSRAGSAPGAVLRSVPDGHVLAVAPETVDAHRFERLLTEAAGARRATTPRGRPAADGPRPELTLSRALAEWSGTALAGVPGPYAEAQRTRLTELRLRAQEEVLDCLLAAGRPAEAVAELQTLAAAHPLRERPRAQLMLALYRSGRQAEALGVFADARRLLRAELGVEPGVRLADLQRRILTADPTLDGPVLDRPPLDRPTLDVPGPECSNGPADPPVPPGGAAHLGGAPRPAPSVPAPRGPLGRPAPPRRPLALRPAAAPGLPTPRELTADVADFTGRREAVEELDGHLRPDPDGAVPVCTVTGPGGVGKTALAVHVAHRVQERFPDGQLHADLHGSGTTPADAGAVLAGFLRTLGTPPASIPEDVDQRAALYRSLLAGRRVLVVLDDARGAGQIGPLLPAGAGCAVLVTSRARSLRPPGARQFELAALPPGEAVELLAAVAGQQRVTAEPRASRELTELCGRLPLAVRIAAGRLERDGTGPSVAELAERLRAAHRWPGEPRTGGGPALEAVLELGLSELAAGPARAFRLAAVAEAVELPLDALAALLGHDPEETEDLAELLVEAGLLEPYGSGSYRYHDLLRQYARRLSEQLDPVEDRQAALARLLDHLLATTVNAGRLIEPDHALHHGLHPTEGPGLPLADAAAARRWLRERHALLAGTVERALRELPSGARAAVDLLLVWYGLVEGPAHRQEFQRLIELAAGAAWEQDTPAAEGRAHYLAGVLHYGTDAYGVAERQLVRSLELAERARDTVGRHLAANALGVLRLATGRPEQALELLLKARELAERTGDRGSAARVLSAISRVRLALGDPERAVADADRAVRDAREVADGAGLARVLYQYGCVLRQAGEPAAAAERLTEALELFRSHGTGDWEGLTLARLAECRLDQGRPEAVGLAARALEITEEVGRTYGQALAQTVLGRATGDRGRLYAALALFDRLGAPEAKAVRELLATPPEGHYPA